MALLQSHSAQVNCAPARQRPPTTSLPACTTRRTVLSLVALLQASSASAREDAGPSPSSSSSSEPEYYQTATGVKIQTLAAGSGPVAAVGETVLFDYVLRRSNGYFIYSTREGVSFQPGDVPVGPIALTLGRSQIIPGLEEVLEGMQPGGKRRALVPPEQAYGAFPALQPQPPTYATQRQLANHRLEPLQFEVQLLRVDSKR